VQATHPDGFAIDQVKRRNQRVRLGILDPHPHTGNEE
jgi:hypothetical protein